MSYYVFVCFFTTIKNNKEKGEIFSPRLTRGIGLKLVGVVVVVAILVVLFKNLGYWASLVAQWLRIRLPMQGTRVRALVWEHPTCRGATKPVRHKH